MRGEISIQNKFFSRLQKKVEILFVNKFKLKERKKSDSQFQLEGDDHDADDRFYFHGQFHSCVNK